MVHALCDTVTTLSGPVGFLRWSRRAWSPRPPQGLLALECLWGASYGRVHETCFLVTAASRGLAIVARAAHTIVRRRLAILARATDALMFRGLAILTRRADATVIRGLAILARVADATVIRGLAILSRVADTGVQRGFAVLTGSTDAQMNRRLAVMAGGADARMYGRPAILAAVADAARHATRGRRLRRPASRRRSVVATAEIEKGKATTTTTIAEIEE